MHILICSTQKGSDEYGTPVSKSTPFPYSPTVRIRIFLNWHSKMLYKVPHKLFLQLNKKKLKDPQAQFF